MKMIKWQPISIQDIFTSIDSGKAHGRNHLHEDPVGRLSYLSAKRNNNGVSAFLQEEETAADLKQPGNCIGFIKNGDGSAGYAIYKSEPFVSTSDVLFGYAPWLNTFTGLFFVTAQDKIQDKYSHGYKRTRERLNSDRVMLPVNDAGEPDYEFMEKYAAQLRDQLLERYRVFLDQQLSKLIQHSIPSLGEKVWAEFNLSDIFTRMQRGKRLKKADQTPGNVPYVSSSAVNNGVDAFIEIAPKSRVFSDCISLANSGSVGKAFYEPFEYVASDHVTMLQRNGATSFEYLFLVTVIEQQKSNFNFNREINDVRLRSLKVMLPTTEDGAPDYQYMAQYAENLMMKKYLRYKSYLDLTFGTDA